MSEEAKNRIVVLLPVTKLVGELLASVRQKSLAEVVETQTQEEAFQEIVSSLPCMFVTCILENQEVPNRLQLFKRLETSVKSHGLKIYVATPLKNRQLADMATQKFGVADYIVEPVPVRTMQFKINLQLKALDNFRRQQELKRLAAEKVVIKKLEGKKAEDGPGSEQKSGQRADEAASDTFVFKGSTGKGGRKVTVEVDGPDPSSGEWVQHESKGDAQATWRWVPHEEKGKPLPPDPPPGSLLHKGDKPIFNERSGKWQMTSEEDPALLAEGHSEEGQGTEADRAQRASLRKQPSSGPASGKDTDGEEAAGKEAASSRPSLRRGDEEDGEAAFRDLSGRTDETEEGQAASQRPDLPRQDPEGTRGSGARPGEEKDGQGPPESRPSLPGPEAADPASFQDKRGTEGSPGTAFTDKSAGTKPEEGKKLSPLEFLRRKKAEQKGRRAELPSLGDLPPTAGARSPRARPGSPEDAGEAAPSPSRASLKKAGRDSSGLLDRLNASLEDGLEPGEDALSSLPEGLEDGPKRRSPLPSRPEEEDGTPEERPGLLRGGAGRKAKQAPGGEAAEARRSQLKKDKKAALDEILALLEGPLPESLETQEEAALREELGLKDRPEIQAKDLVKRHRLKKAKDLKARLAELDLELKLAEEDQGNALSSVPETDTLDTVRRRERDLTAETLQGIRQAIEGGSEEPEWTEEEQRSLRKAKREEGEPKGISLEDGALYMPEAEIQPLGNAWESCDSHYAYLGAQVRYKGFERLADLLPLWTFAGDECPQLLDKTRQWRFRGGRPVRAETVAEIPSAVREFLITLRDRLRKGEAAPEEEPAGAEARAETEAEGAAPEAGAEERRAESLSGKERKAGKPLEAPSLGKGVDELFPDLEGDPEAQAAAGERASGKGPGEEADPLTGVVRGEKKASMLPELGELPEDEESKTRESAELGWEKERKRKEQGSDDAISRLRAKMEQQGLEGGSEGESEEPPEGDRAAEGEPTTESDSAKETIAGSLADKLGSSPALKSERVRKFLQRRKEKWVKAETEGGRAPAKAESGSAGLLGVYVALSDAYGRPGKYETSLARVLTAMEDTFRDCLIFCVGEPDAEGKSAVLFHSTRLERPEGPVDFGSGYTEPIGDKAGSPGRILGYLYFQGVGSRKALETGEEDALKDLAGRIRPLLAQTGARKEGVAA